jgi:DNA-binding CsgD family transcriptional regulator
VLGAADAYQSMREPRPHRPALSAADAAAELRADAHAGRLDSAAVDAVLQAAGHRVARRRDGLPGLTAREVEVLVLVARGLSNKQIAERLMITPKTAGNHVEHIYAKIDASNRATAAMFAVQHRLLPEEKLVVTATPWSLERRGGRANVPSAAQGREQLGPLLVGEGPGRGRTPGDLRGEAVAERAIRTPGERDRPLSAGLLSRYHPLLQHKRLIARGHRRQRPGAAERRVIHRPVLAAAAERDLCREVQSESAALVHVAGPGTAEGGRDLRGRRSGRRRRRRA